LLNGLTEEQAPSIKAKAIIVSCFMLLL